METSLPANMQLAQGNLGRLSFGPAPILLAVPARRLTVVV